MTPGILANYTVETDIIAIKFYPCRTLRIAQVRFLLNRTSENVDVGPKVKPNPAELTKHTACYGDSTISWSSIDSELKLQFWRTD